MENGYGSSVPVSAAGLLHPGYLAPQMTEAEHLAPQMTGGEYPVLWSPLSIPGSPVPPIPLTGCTPVAATAEEHSKRMMEFDKELQRVQMAREHNELKYCSLPVVKVKSGNDLLKFKLKLTLLTINNLKAQVIKRKPELAVAANVFKFMYEDEDGEMITITCDEDLHFCFQYFKSLQQTSIRLLLVAYDNH